MLFISYLYRIETTLHGKTDSFVVEAPNESEARGVAQSELYSTSETIERVVLMAQVVNR